MRERGRHPVVLETAAGVQPLILQKQLPRLHSQLPGEQIGLLENGPAFADGDDVFLAAVERQQFAESPDAGEIQRAFNADALGAPAMLEEAQSFDLGQFFPVVTNIQQPPAFRTGDQAPAPRQTSPRRSD